MYLDCVSTLAQDLPATFTGKKREQLPSLGVVAVPRVLPKGTFVTGFDRTFRFSEHRHALAHYLPRGFYSKLLEQQIRSCLKLYLHSNSDQNNINY